jgi:hypothetical protein
LLCLLAPLCPDVVPQDHGQLLLTGILLAGFRLDGRYWFLCPANHGRTHYGRKHHRGHSISMQCFHYNSFFNLKVRILKSGFEGLANDSDSAGKPVFANRELCQYGVRHDISGRLQTVLLKIAPSQPDPYDTQRCRGGETFTCREWHKSIQ